MPGESRGSAGGVDPIRAAFILIFVKVSQNLAAHASGDFAARARMNEVRMILVKNAALPVAREAARLAAASLLAGMSIALFALGIMTMEAQGSIFCLISPSAEHCGWCLAGALTGLVAAFLGGAAPHRTPA